MDDLINRQAAIDVIFSEPLYETGMKKRSAEEVVPAIFEKVKGLPPAESSIPISWIEKYIDWLGGMKCGASENIAFHVSLMVQRWSKKFLS